MDGFLNTQREKDHTHMRKILILGLAAVIAVLTLGLSTGSANAAATDTALLSSALGSGHAYTGSYDACTGAIAATGETAGATGTYAETVTGTYNKATGSLTLTSVYGMDANGHVDDSHAELRLRLHHDRHRGRQLVLRHLQDHQDDRRRRDRHRARIVQRRPVRGQRQRRHLHPAARPRRRQPRRVRLRRRARWHQGQGPGRDRQGQDQGRSVRQRHLQASDPAAAPAARPFGAGRLSSRLPGARGRAVGHAR